VGAWLLGGGILWLIGAVLIGLVVAFTFIAVMPTNHQLLAPGGIFHPPKLDRYSKSGAASTRCAACLVFWPLSCICCL
jgi:hypothetical protein